MPLRIRGAPFLFHTIQSRPWNHAAPERLRRILKQGILEQHEFFEHRIVHIGQADTK